MTPAEHYAEADRIMMWIWQRVKQGYDPNSLTVARAQVHATLALFDPAKQPLDSPAEHAHTDEVEWLNAKG